MRPYEHGLPTVRDPDHWGMFAVRHVVWMLLVTCVGLASLLLGVGYLVKVELIAEVPATAVVACPEGVCVELRGPAERLGTVAFGDAVRVEMGAGQGAFGRRVVEARVTEIGDAPDGQDRLVRVALEPGATGMPLRGLVVVGQTCAIEALWPFRD